MQYRKPVGFGPSGNTWPRWASHRAHRTSSRSMKRLLSDPIVTFSFATGGKIAAITQLFAKLSLGLFPKLLAMTTDQVELLRHDNVVSAEAKATGLTLEGLGIAPTAIETIVPSYLYRYRKTGQYQAQRLA